MSNALNTQSFDVNNTADILKIKTFYNRDMALVSSSIDLNDEAFLALLAMEHTVDYITRGFGTVRQIVWKYDVDKDTVIRMEVVMPKNAQI